MIENRPSKKQAELFNYIEGFIKENGYGPSYREIMRALGYRSVSTVAVHVDGLITRGLLRKTDNSARSLEVVSTIEATAAHEESHIEWLEKELEKRIKAESKELRREIAILGEALSILKKPDENETQTPA